MAEQTHRIKSQLIEIALPSTADTQKILNDLGRLYRQKIMTLLNSQCSALSSPDEIRRIDHLEIDLGMLDQADLEQQFLTKLQYAFPAALQQQLTDQEAQTMPARHHVHGASQLELLQTFLQHGTVPWWADTANPSLLDDAIAYLHANAPQQLAQFYKTIIVQPDTRRRLVLTFRDNTLDRIAMAVWRDRKSAESSEIQSEQFLMLANVLMAQCIKQGWRQSQARRLTWENILQGTASVSPSTEILFSTILVSLSATIRMSPEAFTDEIVSSMVSSNSLITRLQKQLSSLVQAARLHEDFGVKASQTTAQDGTEDVSDVVVASEAPDVASQTTAQERAEDVSDAREASEAPNVAVEVIGSQNTVSQATADQVLHTEITPSTQQNEKHEIFQIDEQAVELEEVFVANAGLVILWPFLTSVFTQMQLVKENRFTSHETQQKAAGLLQIAASGDAKFAEYVLPLNKVLCGMELETVYELDATDFSTEDNVTIDSFLQSVIEQAPVLRNMSINGLRGSFLLRNGVLRWRDGSWLVQIERETYDVVLDQFPWQWQWVRLSWMSAPIRVEW